MVLADSMEWAGMQVIQKLYGHPTFISFQEEFEFQSLLRKGVIYVWKDQLLAKASLSRDGRTVYFDFFLLGLQKTASLNSLLAKSGLVSKPPAAYKEFMETFDPVLSKEEGLGYEALFCFYLHMTKTVFQEALTDPAPELIEACFAETSEPDAALLTDLVLGKYRPFYYQLRVSEDETVMGASYPLINGIDGEKDLIAERLEVYKGWADGPLPDELDMNLFLMKVGALELDFFSSSYLKSKGLFISKNLSQHFPNYRLNHCKIDELEVNKSYPEKREIRFCHIPDQDELINFSMSTFIKKHDDGNVETVSYPDAKTCLADISAAINEQLPYRVKPGRLYLHKYPDLLRFEAHPMLLISEDFLALLKAQGMKGYTVNQLPFEIL